MAKYTISVDQTAVKQAKESGNAEAPIFRVRRETGTMHASRIEISDHRGRVVAVFSFTPSRKCGSASVTIDTHGAEFEVKLS